MYAVKKSTREVRTMGTERVLWYKGRGREMEVGFKKPFITGLVYKKQKINKPGLWGT